MTAHGSPHFAIPNVVVLDGPAVAAEVTQALDPRILKHRHRLVQHGHHRVGFIDKRDHMVLGGR